MLTFGCCYACSIGTKIHPPQQKDVTRMMVCAHCKHVYAGENMGWVRQCQAGAAFADAAVGAQDVLPAAASHRYTTKRSVGWCAEFGITAVCLALESGTAIQQQAARCPKSACLCAPISRCVGRINTNM